MALFIFVMILILNLLQTSESETVSKSQLFKKAKAKANTGSQQLVSWESESERCKNLGVSLLRVARRVSNFRPWILQAPRATFKFESRWGWLGWGGMRHLKIRISEIHLPGPPHRHPRPKSIWRSVGGIGVERNAKFEVQNFGGRLSGFPNRHTHPKFLRQEGYGPDVGPTSGQPSQAHRKQYCSVPRLAYLSCKCREAALPASICTCPHHPTSCVGSCAATSGNNSFYPHLATPCHISWKTRHINGHVL